MMMLKKVMVVKELDKNVGCGIYFITVFGNAVEIIFFKIDIFC
jgi:hypothetical protein